MHTAHLRALDLNQLRALYVLLECGSVSEAATELGLSQSATSHALGRLRKALSDPLLVRGPKGMLPTPRAIAMKPALDEAFRALERAVEPVAPFVPAEAERRLELTAADYAEFLLLPPLMKTLARIAPGIDVVVRGSERDGAELVAKGESELALGPVLPSNDRAGVRTQKLFDEKFVCLLRRGHPALRRRISKEAFARLGHVFIAPRGKSGGVVDDALETFGLRRRVALQVPHFLVAPFVVAETDYVLTVPERIARVFATKLELVSMKPPLELRGFTLSMLWHERLHADPGHRFLRETIVAEARRLD